MLSVSVNSVPLWLIIVAEKLTLAVCGNRTTESQSAQRTNGRRRLFIPEAIGGLFKDGWKIKNVERLCELCASVVNNPGSIIG